MKSKDQSGLVAAALSYMKENLAKPITVPQIAKAMGYSERYLRLLFTSVTGSGVLPNLLNLRIEKAKELLQHTDLTVYEIARTVGFLEYSAFQKYFLKKTGVSATVFSLKAKSTKEIPAAPAANSTAAPKNKTWYADEAAQGALEPYWKKIEGVWRKQDGIIYGEGMEDAYLGLTKPLPENFRLTFMFCFFTAASAKPSDLLISLRDDSFAGNYCDFVIGAWDNSTAELRHRNSAKQWNPKGVITPGSWQQVSIELQDDIITVTLDGTSIFCFQEPFPPSYPARSKFTIGTWQSAVALKNVTVEDTGFSPLIKTVRQGDSLYNSGLYEQAFNYYTRQLEATDTMENILELRYKTGMCCLRRGMLSQARGWFEKIIPLEGKSYWKDCAIVAALETTWREGNHDAFKNEVCALLKDPLFREAVREIVFSACSGLEEYGFYRESAALYEMVSAEDGKTVWPGVFIQLKIISCILNTDDFKPGEALCRTLLAYKEYTKSISILVLKDYATILTMAGRENDSDKALQEFRRSSVSPAVWAHSELNLAFNLRGRGRFEEALVRMRNVAVKYPDTVTASFAQIEAALLLAATGKIKDARTVLKGLLDIEQQKDLKVLNIYAVDFMDGKYENAALLLIKNFRHGEYAVHARQAVTAGILLELAARRQKRPEPLLQKARKIWEETRRRFPASRVCFYAELAEGFLSGNDTCIEKMPYKPWYRSEMFYLAGLLHEARGNRKRAAKLFKIAVKEDPTNRWPAFLAKKKVDSDL